MRVSDYITCINHIASNSESVEADNDGPNRSRPVEADLYCFADKTSQDLGKYRLNPHERRRRKIRRRHLSEELDKVLYGNDAQIGVDGSIVRDGDDVYLLEAPFQDRVTKIDYFIGYHFGVPCAQVWNGYKEHHSLVMNMVRLGSWGVAVHCITVLQRKWRNRRWQLRVQPGLIQLAKKALMQVSSV